MPNAQIKDDKFTNDNGEAEKYTALAMQESRLKKAKEEAEETGDWTKFYELGGETELKRLEGVVHTAQNINYNKKKVGKDVGRENQFIRPHEKDQNSNPTGVGGIPKVHKGSLKDKIMTNKEVYSENLKKEIDNINYLIEYINNNKTKIK